MNLEANNGNDVTELLNMFLYLQFVLPEHQAFFWGGEGGCLIQQSHRSEVVSGMDGPWVSLSGFQVHSLNNGILVPKA